MKHGRHALRILPNALSATLPTAWLSTFLPQDNNRQRQQGQKQRLRIPRRQSIPQGMQQRKKLRRRFTLNMQTQKILDLRNPDQHRNPIGKTDNHRHRNEFNQNSHAKKTHCPQHETRHKRGQQQPADTIALDNSIHNHDKRTRRPANLHARAAEQRNQKTRNNRRENTSFGLQPRRNRKRHCQRQSHDRHGRTGAQIFDQSLGVITAHDFVNFRIKLGGNFHSEQQLTLCADKNGNWDSMGEYSNRMIICPHSFVLKLFHLHLQSQSALADNNGYDRTQKNAHISRYGRFWILIHEYQTSTQRCHCGLPYYRCFTRAAFFTRLVFFAGFCADFCADDF